MTKRKRRPRRRDGRVPFTTRMAKSALDLIRQEAERVHGTKRRANVVIEELAREHLPRSK
jgi:hypothetical protein